MLNFHFTVTTNSFDLSVFPAHLARWWQHNRPSFGITYALLFQPKLLCLEPHWSVMYLMHLPWNWVQISSPRECIEISDSKAVLYCSPFTGNWPQSGNQNKHLIVFLLPTFSPCFVKQRQSFHLVLLTFGCKSKFFLCDLSFECKSGVLPNRNK